MRLRKGQYNRGMSALIAALQNPRCYPHPVASVRLIETHISWVLLTGEFAYKVKKPVTLDFLDFGTLDKRHACCLEELRLNRRLAPELYLDVVPIAGPADEPRVAGAGDPIEFALRMREFPQAALLSNRLAHGEVAPRHVEAIADALARFHECTAAAAPDAVFGSAATLLQACLDNFAAVERLLAGNGMHLRIGTLRRWTHDRHARLIARFSDRRSRGRIRDCHGDLHSGNVALIDDAPAIFDCIEFNAAFRWIDVMSELAFIVMDLAARGRTDFAYRLLNRYLEHSGDYAGLHVLRYYLVYRAMVRAKIDCIRARQPDLPASEGARVWQDFVARVSLAERFATGEQRLLAITHGLSGSGKSSAALHAAERLGFVRIRSDVERKRLFGLRAGEPSHSALAGGIYTAGASERVYDRLSEHACAAVEGGFGVIVDAAFLQRDARMRFRELARSLGARFAVIDCRAGPGALEARIEARARLGADPSEADLAVLERQRQVIEPLDASERPDAIEIDVEAPVTLARMVRTLGAAEPG
jgi:aminoglycoside phosphotransferase family enzyme/predicted kinase